MAKEAYYFSHDANSRTDPKILSMMLDYGIEGYGMFWIVVENLREQSNYKLKQDKTTWRALAMQMHKTVDEVKVFITDCIKEYELFINDETFFYSESLLRRMNKKDEITQKRKDAANARWKDKNNASDMQMHSKSNANDMQLDAKESKLNKGNKEKKVFIPPTFIEVEKYILEKQYVVDPKFFLDYFEAREWINANGKPVASWKGTIVTWNKSELSKNPGAKPYKKKEAKKPLVARRDDY